MRPRLRPTTWNSYRQSVAHIKGRIGAVPLYKQLLATRGRNGRLLNLKTVRGIHVVLRKALADAERLGLVVRNAAAAANPPLPPKYEHTTWTAGEIAVAQERWDDFKARMDAGPRVPPRAAGQDAP